MTDHYTTLGVSRDADADEIKRSYRKLARQLHPDANDDPDAEERFKEVTRAYEVLSDPEKRRRYDMYGDERAEGVGFPDFGGLSDLFASFFGGPTARRRGPARGADLLAEIEITLEQAAAGVRRDIEVPSFVECDECAGAGTAPGTFPTRCNECGGSGELRQVRRTMLGSMVTATTCPRCGGRGEEILSPCKSCSGRGRIRSVQKMTIDVPAGIEDGARLRVGGRGEAGTRGARPGDLFVAISVIPHPVFRRAGADLGCEVKVPFTVAALGGIVDVPTLDGPEELDVGPGTQPGDVVRLRGRGMPELGGGPRGDLVVLITVPTPTDLDAEQKDLLKRLAELRGEPAGRRGFVDRVKEVFK